MNEDSIRQAARELCAIQQQVFPMRLTNGFRGEFSLLDLAMLGLTVVTSASDLLTPDRRSFTVNPKLMSALLHSRTNPEILVDYYHNLFVESAISPTELIDNSRKFRGQVEEPRALHKLKKEVVAVFLPPQKAGRPAKLDRSDWPILLAASERLRPLCINLARLQRSSKNHNLEDNLNYLRADFPEAVEFLFKYLDRVKSTLSQCSFLSKHKTSTRHARLADALAGVQFRLTPKYAIQQAARARNGLRKAASD